MGQADALPPEAAQQTGAQPETVPKSGGLKLRIASTLVMAPLALGAVWLGSPYFPLLVALLAIAMGREWARLSGATALAVKLCVILTPLVAVAAVALGAPALAVLFALLGGIATGSAALVAKAPAPLWTASGTVWLTLPSVAIIWIEQLTDGRALVVWLLAAVWASDIGAYAAGRVLGGPRLAPRLSPNKTWAGAVGGLFGAALAGWGVAIVFSAPSVAVVAVSLLLSVAAQLGDLTESLAKRKFGAKDSGGIIPGHGGVLDRLDSLLTATLVLALLILIFTRPGITTTTATILP